MIKELKVCKICNEQLSNSHPWNNHRMSLKEYFETYEPKLDLLTNEKLPFKSVDHYFDTNFLNKNNLKKYLKGLHKDKATEFCKDMLVKRKVEKNLIYAPLQIELASLPCFPPVHYLFRLFNYYGFCQEIGLINKFQSHNNFHFNLDADNFNVDNFNLDNNLNSHYIVIDSRESQPIKFDIKYRIDKLDFGDYYFSGNSNVYFERKSLGDFLSTLTQGLERFTKELERANNAGIYLVMIIENTLQEALIFNHLPWMKRVKTKATPDYIFHNLRELIQKFPKFQPFFVNGRTQVKEYMMKGFFSGDTFCNYDLQLLYQLKLI